MLVNRRIPYQVHLIDNLKTNFGHYELRQKKTFITIHQIGFVHFIIKAEVQFKLFIMREREIFVSYIKRDSV